MRRGRRRRRCGRVIERSRHFAFAVDNCGDRSRGAGLRRRVVRECSTRVRRGVAKGGADRAARVGGPHMLMNRVVNLGASSVREHLDRALWGDTRNIRGPSHTPKEKAEENGGRGGRHARVRRELTPGEFARWPRVGRIIRGAERSTRCFATAEDPLWRRPRRSHFSFYGTPPI